MRVRADEPARVGEREQRGDARGEAPRLETESCGRGRQDSHHRDEGDREAAEATERGKAFRGGRQRLGGVGVDRRRDDPAEQVGAARRGDERQRDDDEAEDQRDEILVERRRRLGRGKGCIGHVIATPRSGNEDGDVIVERTWNFLALFDTTTARIRTWRSRWRSFSSPALGSVSSPVRLREQERPRTISGRRRRRFSAAPHHPAHSTLREPASPQLSPSRVRVWLRSSACATCSNPAISNRAARCRAIGSAWRAPPPPSFPPPLWTCA